MYCSLIHNTELQTKHSVLWTNKSAESVSSRLRRFVFCHRKLGRECVFVYFLFKFLLALWKKKWILVFLMSRVHEIVRGGLGASEVSANCRHIDSVFLKGPWEELRSLTFVWWEYNTRHLHIIAPSERGIISKILHKLLGSCLCSPLVIFLFLAPSHNFNWWISD